MTRPTRSTLVPTILAVLAALLVALLAACDDSDPRAVPQPPPPASETSTGSAAPAAPIRRTHLPTGRIGELPRLKSHLPERVPAADAALPSLLDDLPGRALMTYHPPEQWFAGPSGWASEDIMFFGADGRWRVLRMEDLGLPESAWVADTYGPGALSSDGRWWVAFSGEGPIVLNLATGELVPTDLHDYTAPPKWIPGEHAFVTHRVGHRGRSISVRISAADGTVTGTPYAASEVGFLPDGTPISLHRTSRTTEELVAWRGAEAEAISTVIGDPVAPRTTARRSGVLATTTRLVRVAGRPAHVTGRHASTLVEVIDIDSGRVEASLRITGPAAYRELLGWLDPDTVALVVDGHLLAYRPDEGRVHRVTEMPTRGIFTQDLAAAPGYY